MKVSLLFLAIFGLAVATNSLESKKEEDGTNDLDIGISLDDNIHDGLGGTADE